MVTLLSTPGGGGAADLPEASGEHVEPHSEVVQTMVRRIMGKNIPLCLVTLRLVLTLLKIGREEFFHEACMRSLLADARASAAVVPTTGLHASPSVLIVHAARELLSLRPAPFESNPEGPDFDDYIAEARRGVQRQRAACATWKAEYNLQMLQHKVQQQPQSLVSGVLGGLRWAILSNSSAQGDPAALGLWGALLQKLRGFLHQSAKVNLLLTQV